jgi:hypothetical protein
MTALLCLSKTDFDDIELYRQDYFFRRSRGLKAVASAETLHQWLNDVAPIEDCSGMVRRENAYLVSRHAPAITPCYKAWVPLDIDVSPFDNSGTQKKGVSCTYK